MFKAKNNVFMLASGRAQIRLYDVIGSSFWSDGTTANDIAAQLDSFGEVNAIDVRINSPGGSVTEGVAIYNILKAHGAEVTVYVDGMALSIASVIAMAAAPGRLFMADNALMMIHDPWTNATGNAADMRGTADVLDKVKAAIMTSYVARSGMDKTTLSDLMSAESWFTADEARGVGLADAVVENVLDVEAMARFDLSGFRNAAKAFTPAHAGSPEVLNMTTTPAKPANPADIESAHADGQKAGAVAERKRCADIRAVFAAFAVAGDAGVAITKIQDACIEDANCSADDASKKLLAELGKNVTPATPVGTTPARTVIEIAADDRDKFVAGMSLAINARFGLEKADPANNFNGMSLQTMVRASLRRAGVENPERLSNQALASRFFALSTSDFPLILANTASKALRKAYDLQPTTWRLWCDVGQVPDFKSSSRLQMGTFNSLATIPEGGEYEYGDFSEEGETIQASTKGKALALTRQMIINDDLGAFVSRGQKMGFAAARTINEDVYSLLLSNPNTADGGATFNATAETTGGGHANLTGSGTAISAASIGVGVKTMRVHKDKGLRTTLNITPKTLLVPAAQQVQAWTLLNSVNDPDATTNAGKANFARSLGLQLVVDSLLDSGVGAVAGSSTGWYLISDPNLVPLIEVAFLDGVEAPYTDEAVDWDTDALKMKVRMDYGLAVVDWRAGYKNAGA